MKKLIALVMVAFCAIAGCSSDSAVDTAKKMIADGRAECILVRDNEIVAFESGGGVNPLLHLYDTAADKMAGATVVDKVIGRAAAFIAINGGATSVYGELMSQDGAELLAAHNIAVSYGTMVPRILNRNRDGLCPLEQSVLGFDDPVAALEALRARIAEMQQQ